MLLPHALSGCVYSRILFAVLLTVFWGMSVNSIQWQHDFLGGQHKCWAPLKQHFSYFQSHYLQKPFGLIPNHLLSHCKTVHYNASETESLLGIDCALLSLLWCIHQSLSSVFWNHCTHTRTISQTCTYYDFRDPVDGDIFTRFLLCCLDDLDLLAILSLYSLAPP